MATDRETPPPASQPAPVRRHSFNSADEGRERTVSPKVSPKNNADVRLANSAAAESGSPPLPYDETPPLPEEVPPADDGWDYAVDTESGRFYFINKYTGVTQWENPRDPQATAATTSGSYDRIPTGDAASPSGSTSQVATTQDNAAQDATARPRLLHGGYNPAIHGSYDPNADYAILARQQQEEEEAAAQAAVAEATQTQQQYTVSAQFNRFSGKFQDPSRGPSQYNHDTKSRNQLNSFFDVDAHSNNHDGRSLKEERRNKKLTKKELKEFQRKRREKKEEKKRKWLLD